MDIVTIDQDAYKRRSYEEFSDDFRRNYSRAVELIPLMYNRLTLVDGLTHKAAIKKSMTTMPTLKASLREMCTGICHHDRLS